MVSASTGKGTKTLHWHAFYFFLFLLLLFFSFEKFQITSTLGVLLLGLASILGPFPLFKTHGVASIRVQTQNTLHQRIFLRSTWLFLFCQSWTHLPTGIDLFLTCELVPSRLTPRLSV